MLNDFASLKCSKNAGIMYKSLVELCTKKTGGLGEQRRGGARATARKLLFETQKTVIKLGIVNEPRSQGSLLPTLRSERARILYTERGQL